MKFEVLKRSYLKKNIIIGIVVVLVLSAVVLTFTRAKYRTTQSMPLLNGTINYTLADLNIVAMYLDGEQIDTLPDGNYELTSESYCTNEENVKDETITLSYDSATKGLSVSPMTKKGTKCYLYFEEEKVILTGKMADSIIANAGVEPIVNDDTIDNNPRYIGADPNNYVSFNNELWRIIGVFNNIDDGTGNKETRLKIIRNEPIGIYSWDNKAIGTGSSDSQYGSNDWSDSALQQVLNSGAYYNRTSGECPKGGNGATTSCDFSSIGLTETAKAMISNAKWNLGGTANYTSSSNGLTSHWYGYERGTTVYSGRPTEWIGQIGLMYPSDYGYATNGGSTTDRASCLAKELINWSTSSYSDCKNNDWLYSGTGQWTLTPSTSYSTSVFIMNSIGSVGYDNNTLASNGVSPTLYLSSNVRISGGTGEKSDPFTLTL